MFAIEVVCLQVVLSGVLREEVSSQDEERDILSEVAVSSRTVVTFVTWLISRTEFSSSELL